MQIRQMIHSEHARALDTEGLRRHFLVEVNAPRCRLIDLNSHNGVLLNGARVQTAEVADGDEIAAGHTVFKVHVIAADPGQVDAILWDGSARARHRAIQTLQHVRQAIGLE